MMSEEVSSEPRTDVSTPTRRPRGATTRARTGTRRTATGRRRRQGGPELVESLHAMIDQLIKENRKLKRQIVKLASAGTAATGQTVERGLRTIQRRVQRALDGAQPRRR